MRIVSVDKHDDEVGLIVTKAELQFLLAQVAKHTGLSAHNYIKSHPVTFGEPLYAQPKLFRNKVFSTLKDAYYKHAYKKGS